MRCPLVPYQGFLHEVVFLWVLHLVYAIKNREQRSNPVATSAQLMKEGDINLIVSPEGTRSYAEKWKSGFYYIAKEAGVDISLGLQLITKQTGGDCQVAFTNNFGGDESRIDRIL